MSINFREIQFPSDIAYGATGGPEFFTDIVTSSSGFEQRNMNWLQARCCYNLAPAIKNKEQLEAILIFFRLCQGKAIGFRFKDWSDYQIEHQQIATADGNQINFQLIKKYHYLNYQTVRKILKPTKDTVKIYCNEKLVFPEIDFSNGQIKFKEPPSEGVDISVEAEFDVPVRFDIDRLITSVESYAVYSHHEIPLVEIKL